MERPSLKSAAAGVTQDTARGPLHISVLELRQPAGDAETSVHVFPEEATGGVAGGVQNEPPAPQDAERCCRHRWACALLANACNQKCTDPSSGILHCHFNRWQPASYAVKRGFAALQRLSYLLVDSQVLPPYDVNTSMNATPPSARANSLWRTCRERGGTVQRPPNSPAPGGPSQQGGRSRCRARQGRKPRCRLSLGNKIRQHYM